MGPKRKLGPKSRRRRKEDTPSSSEDETETVDTNRILLAEKLDPDYEKEEEADVDNPEERPSYPSAPKVAENGRPKKVALSELHRCLMNVIAPINSHTASERCVKGNPMMMKLEKIPSHYYMHYRERKHWDKIVTPITEEDKAQKRFEYFQCKLCDQKFRVRNDPDPARASFCYHFAIYHGKIINAMQDDEDIDMKDVLDIIHQTNVNDLRRFIIEGTDNSYSDGPCIPRESCEYRMKHRGLGKNLPAPTQGNNSVIVNRSNYLTIPRNIHRVTGLYCPFNDLPECKNHSNEKHPLNLMLHLFHHYIDYWKDLVPVFTSSDTKCIECQPAKKISGESPEACRTAMICHRAIIHEELKQAITEDLREFDDELFKRLFSPDSVKLPQVMYSKNSSKQPAASNNTTNNHTSSKNIHSNNHTNNSDNQEANQELPDPERTMSATKKPSQHLKQNKTIIRKPTTKRKKNGEAGKKSVKNKKTMSTWFDKEEDSESESESDVDDLIPQQPYARARIKQNLKLSDLSDDDSDSDEEFSVKKMKIDMDIAPRFLPKRRNK